MAITARTATELQPGLHSTWTISAARNAIGAHEMGDFAASSQLFDAMGRDDRIEAVMATRTQAVMGLPFSIEADLEADKRRRTSMTREVDSWWWDCCPESVLEEAIKWRVGLGFAVGQLTYDYRDARGKVTFDRRRPRLKVWHPQFIRYDWVMHSLVAQTTEGEVPITHGDGQWVVFAAKGARPWMQGAVRSLMIPWLIRQFAWRDWARQSERNGMPIIVAKSPISVAGDEEVRQWYTRIQHLGQETTAHIPTGLGADGNEQFGLDLLESKANNWEGFERLIMRADTSIAIRLLGQNLSTEVKGGSFAAAKSQERVRQDYLEADAQGLSTDTHTGILEPWASAVHGNAALAPWAIWDASLPEDLKVAAEGQKVFGEALGSIDKAGFEVENVDELSERYGLKLKRKAPAPMPVAAPPALPAVDDDPVADPKPANDVTEVAASEREEDPGFRQGQEFVDELVAKGTQRASEALAVDIANILRIVQASDSPKAMMAGLTALYASATPTELGAVLERARILAELAGKFSAIEDVMGSV